MRNAAGDDVFFVDGKVFTIGSKLSFQDMRDSYGVDIAEGEDDVLILASTVVIDMACLAIGGSA